MKKVLKVIGIALAAIVVIIGGVMTYVAVALPNVGEAPDLKVEATEERIARGKYLANAVNVCLDCHSTRDWGKYSGPVIEGTMGKGGEEFNREMGFPGVYYSKNITPAGIGRYTDGELYRVITSGVTKEGRAMFPVMPYQYYGKMDDEDVYSLIAYLRTLEPIENQVPESTTDFPVNIILKTIPAKGTPTKRPALSDTLAYGAYMANASGCVECHSPVKDNKIDPERQFAGGREFGFPSGAVVRSSNISMDPETGIGKWSRQAFIQRFKSYADSSYVPPAVGPNDFNTMMPWMMYANMTEEDLGSIYAYLKSLPAHHNPVVKYTPPAAAN